MIKTSSAKTEAGNSCKLFSLLHLINTLTLFLIILLNSSLYFILLHLLLISLNYLLKLVIFPLIWIFALSRLLFNNVFEVLNLAIQFQNEFFILMLFLHFRSPLSLSACFHLKVAVFAEVLFITWILHFLQFKRCLQ